MPDSLEIEQKRDKSKGRDWQGRKSRKKRREFREVANTQVVNYEVQAGKHSKSSY